jgi:hypothetical protein
MEKTATITRTVFKNEYTGQHGKVYYHDIELDNGDKGSIGAKDKEPSKLNPGQSLTYTLEVTDKGTKIKAVSAKPSFNGGGKFQQDPRVQFISFSMSYAKDLMVGGKIEEKNLINCFEKIYKAMESKYNEIKS